MPDADSLLKALEGLAAARALLGRVRRLPRGSRERADDLLSQAIREGLASAPDTEAMQAKLDAAAKLDPTNPELYRLRAIARRKPTTLVLALRRWAIF